ncbi:LysR family transcriptional regulator [Undibacterium sp.]|uniref:LysR family transcriptional regulator n=1 Tax=Undibacterium sp. TaxID=1914977 RepID=UPI00374C9B60
MDRLLSMKTFVRVVETANFSKAAEDMQMPAASASRMVQALEAHLKIKLLNRTTRNVSLTEEGRIYYERCLLVLSEIDDMEEEASGARTSPQGRIRISLPGSVAKSLLIPALPEFYKRFPDIDMELSISDRRVDLVEDGMDCSIRIGPVNDQLMVAKKVGEVSLIACASPGYLAQYGEPLSLPELAHHHAVHYQWSSGTRVRPWQFFTNGESELVSMTSQLAVNDADSYIACGAAGLGIIAGYQVILAPHIRAGVLKEILPAYRRPPVPVSVLYPPNRHVPHKIRAFIAWFGEVFAAADAAIKTVEASAG